MAAQECDCDFSTSGDTVFYPEFLEFYLKKIKQTNRPIQLTDSRRNHFKIKHDNIWLDSETEECKKLIKSIISSFNDKIRIKHTAFHRPLLQKLRSENKTEYNRADNIYNNQIKAAVI